MLLTCNDHYENIHFKLQHFRVLIMPSLENPQLLLSYFGDVFQLFIM